LSYVTTYAIASATRKVAALEERSVAGLGRDVSPEDELVRDEVFCVSFLHV
jgi:hypothetical protein